MGETIQQSAGEPFGTEHFDPVLKGQIGGDDETGALVCAADRVEEQFGTGLGKGHVAKFVEDEQVEPFELLHKALQVVVIALLEHMPNTKPTVAHSRACRRQPISLTTATPGTKNRKKIPAR